MSRQAFEASPTAQVRKNDILVTRTGYVSMGKVDVYDRDEPAIVDSHVAIVRVNADYDPYFVAYFLRSHLGQLQFDKWFTGSSGRLELVSADLSRFLVPAASAGGCPPAEQKRIARQITRELVAAQRLRQQALVKQRAAERSFEDALARRG